MFILGFHFPASMGNNIEDSAVVAKLDEAVGNIMATVATVKLYSGNSEYKTLTNTSTLLAKGLVNYFETSNPERDPKYMTYTDKYQLGALSKRLDTDAEAQEVAKFFDGREQITVEVTYK